MEISGVVPHDAPDPAIARWAEVESMPVPVYGFAVQPALEELPAWSTSSDTDVDGLSEITASPSYTLWRFPEDKLDARNLAELDASTRATLDHIPPWPRPEWLIRGTDQRRYPMLWEAVRTTWQRPGATRRGLHHILAEHMYYININRHRSRAQMQMARDGSLEIPDSSGVNVMVDGEEVPGIRMNFSDHLTGVGVELAEGTIVTAVASHEDLQFFKFALATRWQPAP